MTGNSWTYNLNIYKFTAYQVISKYTTLYSHSKILKPDVNNLYKLIYSLNSLLQFDSMTKKKCYPLETRM